MYGGHDFPALYPDALFEIEQAGCVIIVQLNLPAEVGHVRLVYFPQPDH